MIVSSSSIVSAAEVNREAFTLRTSTKIHFILRNKLGFGQLVKSEKARVELVLIETHARAPVNTATASLGKPGINTGDHRLWLPFLSTEWKTGRKSQK